MKLKGNKDDPGRVGEGRVWGGNDKKNIVLIYEINKKIIRCKYKNWGRQERFGSKLAIQNNPDPTSRSLW